MKIFAQLSLYWHTIKYLRIQQILFQCYFRLKKPVVKKIVTPNVCKFNLSWNSSTHNVTSLSNELEFFALGKSALITDAKIWNTDIHSKLWLYNLHYFDAIKNDGREDVYTKYIDLWIENNPPVIGNGWEPYTISIRTVNWIKYFTQINNIKKSWIDSLAIQADVLANNIEYHLLANHVLANAKALIFLGIYFSGDKANFWLHKGLKILTKQLKEQFLPDGGHFELSPMYHAILLWDLCELFHLAQQIQRQELIKHESSFIKILLAGWRWLHAMSHPDGNIAFFNDATFKIAPTCNDLLMYFKTLGIHDDIFDSAYDSDNYTSYPCEQKLTSLTSSGYFVVDMKNCSRAIIDIAKIGPKYQAGHAHADTLSFELSLFSKRFLVNSGISEYGCSAKRLFQRGTKAHNTVVVHQKNSSEVWHGFRVARRANAFWNLLQNDDDKIVLHGWHDGYRLLSLNNRHHRTWTFANNSLLIEDRVSGKKTNAEARFYFHPEVIIKSIGENKLILLVNNREVFMRIFGAKDMRIERSEWFLAFGESQKNNCLVISFDAQELQTHILWQDY